MGTHNNMENPIKELDPIWEYKYKAILKNDFGMFRDPSTQISLKSYIKEKYNPKHFGEKKSYSQDWNIYYKACRTEK